MFSLNDVGFLGTVSPALDADAAAYIAAVEAADTQALETNVRIAINAFVVGCKADGIWTPIKASCILAGARTLSGALVPLVGAAPTNVGGLFVSGDYNRKTGLVGNGSTKYLNSNRNNNADPQNSKHLSVYISTLASITSHYISGRATAAFAGSSQLLKQGSNNRVFMNGTLNAVEATQAAGFFGGSRPSSALIENRTGGATTQTADTSSTPANANVLVFAVDSSGITLHSDARLAFYSIGESLDLALLDARVTTLVNAFAAAIP